MINCNEALSPISYSLNGTTRASAPPSKYSTTVALLERPSLICVLENEDEPDVEFNTMIGLSTSIPSSILITVVAGAKALFNTANVSLS